MSTEIPPKKFGINYPLRKGRILLTVLMLLFVLYLVGSLFFLIPAVFFIAAAGSGGLVLTLAFISGIIGYLSYRSYKRTISSMLNDAEQVTRQDYPELSSTLDLIEREAQARDMNIPSLYIHPNPAVNASAIGGRKNGHIIIFDGLLVELDDTEELNAIVGHELAHLYNRDSILMAVMTGLKETLIRFWTTFAYTLHMAWYQRQGIILTPAEETALKQKMRQKSEEVCSPIGLCQKSLSRHREYIADAEGARISDPDSMIRALEIIAECDNNHQDVDIPQSLCVYGSSEGMFSRLKSTHPPAEKRIRNIEKIYQ